MAEDTSSTETGKEANLTPAAGKVDSKMDPASTQETTRETPLSEVAEKDKKESGAAGKKLTPEEQMALYEEALKEEDWGHQPC